MVKKKEKKRAANPGKSTVRDPYTGEQKPPIEGSEKFIEIVPKDSGDRKGEKYLLNEETSMDYLAADENADTVIDQVTSYTEDEDIGSDFAERQRLASGGRKVLEEELDEHHSRSPEISAGDIDASWATSDQAGEETVGASVPTPDQDQVDEIGKAAGLTYNDDEPLNYDKIRQRDRQRWELNPASGLEQNQELEDVLEDIEEDEEKNSSAKRGGEG